MKNRTWLTAVVLLTTGACTGTPTPNIAPAPGSGSVALLALEPPAGSTVDASTVLRATLSYELPPDAPGSYFVMAQFATQTEGATFDGKYPGPYPRLRKPQGEVSVRFPMHYVLNHRVLATPIQVWFYLNYRTEPGRSRVVARTGPFGFELRH